MAGYRVIALVGALELTAAACAGFDRSTLPAALSDADFWRLSADLSEPAGIFTHSENLVSNELQFVNLIRRVRPVGGVYFGVGPEQNFSYIAALRPAMAFIVDIRRENQNLQLLYKALFEISTDRADFLSRLFSRERPAGLSADSSVDRLFEAFGRTAANASLLEVTRGLVRERLVDVHRFPLTTEDLNHIDHALRAFFDDGPEITYGRSIVDDEPRPSYRALMTVRDIAGVSRSYLASRKAFDAVKALQDRNLIVPVVGDFAGPIAMRGVGEFVRRHRSTVSVFYGSNVEVYLNQVKTVAYCGNIASLPYARSTLFISNKAVKPFPARLKACPGIAQ